MVRDCAYKYFCGVSDNKIARKNHALNDSRQPVIVCLGDSVTQGCFECYSQNGELRTICEERENYGEKLKRLLQLCFPFAPVTVVNAGISGGRAKAGLKRLERDVLSYSPDLVVVCFGLNDATAGEEGLEEYISSLRQIFEKIKKFEDTEIIFLTPNMRTDSVSPLLEDQIEITAAKRVAENEEAGWLKKYIEEAKKLCCELNIPVCDCYHIYEQFKNSGVDINELLSNKINHPLRELHWIFAYELIKIIFSNEL